MFRYFQIITREFSRSLLKSLCIHDLVRFCKQSVVAANHVAQESVVERVVGQVCFVCCVRYTIPVPLRQKILPRSEAKYKQIILHSAGDKIRDGVLGHKGSCWQIIIDKCENDTELLPSASRDALTWIARLKNLSPNIPSGLKGLQKNSNSS